MSVKSVDKDLDALTLTLVAEFSATTEQVWDLWADPRKLEQWWGPPTYPATVVDHDLTPGGQVTYFMTGPEGDTHHAWWRMTAVDEPKSLEFVDGFADADGKPVDTMPTNTTTMTLSPYDGGTRMELRSVFDTSEQMEQLISMGMAEGLTASVGQMDALLA
ncbi:SRPBCC domain-containing protein [Kribbella albertanoniae]|uniref:SRPBCC domain-containing protein n=1 Tax=Kribbella albertanoniae TaxID=1266829 RepID=A0A4R4PV13_9ACTN|nr:SRPBCC domain-containing protein [Kribbella albertanoniae]TDC26139.1 SRPBCC domain-containing protein [Kribbella albertanoniae]